MSKLFDAVEECVSYLLMCALGGFAIWCFVTAICLGAYSSHIHANNDYTFFARILLQ